MKIMTMAAMLLLVACGGPDDGPAQDEEAATPIADDLQKPMDKAADVERQLMENKERMDAALDEADTGKPERQP